MGVTTTKTGESAVAVEESEPSLDANGINPSQFPTRILPDRVTGRSRHFQVVFDKDTVDAIRAHSESTPEAEICGVLVGNIYRDGSGPYCYVKANIEGDHAPSRNSQVTFTSETWTHIHEQMDAHYPHDRIVGWYHSHPGFGIFLSEMDLFIQNNFFNEPWQIAYVDDPVGDDCGVFVWENGTVARRPHLLESKAGPSAPAAPEPATTPAPAADSTIDGTPAIGPDRRRQKIGDRLETSVRINVLERQIIAQRKQSRRSMIVALVWPLVLIAGLIWAGVIPADTLRNSKPVKWSVAKWTQISAAIHAGR
jgi:proteasome lid subunit RPN8/RPN11